MFDIIYFCSTKFNKLAKAKPVYLYHGTNKDNLSSILSQGLIPEPKERAWQEDPHASWHSPSRKSLPGIYLTDNLMTAISATHHGRFEKRKSNPVIIIVQVQPQSLLMDEDKLYSVDDIVFPGYNVNEYVAVELYLEWMTKENSKFVQEARNEYIKNSLSSILYRAKEKQLHPKLEEELRKILESGFYVALTRKIVHIDEKYYINLASRYNKDFYHNAPKRPSIAEAEILFKTYQDKLSKLLKIFARPANLEDLWNFTARSIEPIRFSKSNRIIAIFEEIREENYHENRLKLIYPNRLEEIPKEAYDKFVNDWTKSVGEFRIEAS